MFKGRTPLVIATLLGLGAVVAAWGAIRLREREVTSGWELGDVVVAAAAMGPGDTLTSDGVSYAKMPTQFIYDSVLRPSDLEYALGREVLVPIKEGEPIHWYQLQGIRALERLSKAVRKRGRAVTITVDERASVGQWVRPNDHVDVLGTFRDPISSQMVAVTLLQNVIILATGKDQASSNVATADGDFSTVTLLVLPEEAEILALAEEMGSLRLSLRNPDDISVFEERARTTMETLLTGERVRKLQERRLQTIQIIRGIQPGKALAQ